MQTTAIDDLLKRVETLPPAPKLLPQLLAALADMEADLRHVVDLITYDPSLTAKVLQVCNSAYYGFSVPVNTVEDAVNRLGFHGVYLIVAVVSGENVLKTGSHSALDANAMWRHLLISAFAAQSLGKRVGADGNMLFTTALLHDIGKVPLADVLQGDYDVLITNPSLLGRELVALESASFALNHAEVGARLLENWTFSPEFVQTVRWHHDPASAGDAAKLAACVELADLLAHSFDNGEEKALAEDTARPALAITGISMAELERQRELVKGKLKEVDAMCGPAR
jgi:putative nucleotidyltransferase with HDIG domain